VTPTKKQRKQSTSPEAMRKHREKKEEKKAARVERVKAARLERLERSRLAAMGRIHDQNRRIGNWNERIRQIERGLLDAWALSHSAVSERLARAEKTIRELRKAISASRRSVVLAEKRLQAIDAQANA
jgi:hypothetical protein